MPITGAFYNRYKWRRFRNIYNDLRQAPLLDYKQYRNLENDGSIFKFTGGIESLTDGKILWVRGNDCTLSVSLEKAQCWLLPMNEGEDIPSPPELIKWNRVSTLTEGVKVFIGGRLIKQNSMLNFAAPLSKKDKPLMVIFYNCPEDELTKELILAARTRNEYWNPISLFSLAVGALALIYIAASLLGRPAFRLTVITALVAVFSPILPIIPPGLLFSALFRRLSWQARKLRAYRDLGLLDNPAEKIRYFGIKAYSLEIISWIIMIIGIAVNLFFIYLILSLLA